MKAGKSNYDKFPATSIEDGMLITGWNNILKEVTPNVNYRAISIECYNGVYYEEVKLQFKKIPHVLFIDTTECFKPEEEILQLTKGFITEDVLFGYLGNLSIHDYFDDAGLNLARKKIAASREKGNIILFGPGSSLITHPDLLIYADMPRWEIQRRMRRKEVTGLGIDNREEPFSIQYKRGYFNDWNILDKHKKKLYGKVDYWLDTTKKEPKLIDKKTFFAGIEKTARKPFRVVPFFDPAPWGGQWMKDVCDLDGSVQNYGWCFDCVPEENSLLFDIGGILFEMPSVNLVYLKSREILGDPVESRFGDNFPIRFDLLDTMGGGNLSLQVHPTLQYARDSFGLPYTQDESYYLVDAEEDAVVYLGLKSGIDRHEMIADLEKANQNPGEIFDEKKYVNILPARKHDHFLIPAGTIHCSGKNSVVLEISATPNLFTFKLWDWNRLGLDGKPRPINLERGKEVIRWDRDTDYVSKELANQFQPVGQGDGWKEERTGLHRNEFIETRRHTFSKTIRHVTGNSVNVLTLLEGKEVIVESPDKAFEPFIVHYAEAFIVPAHVNEYLITPHGESGDKECITIKASVRF
ncbi:MAG: class I mannose-6-phosphate isomerase [Porphyromonadaceae bacterium]|nr:class I mannose-6-phosphate isomerase [Porphyromonadaceae bacterium]